MDQEKYLHTGPQYPQGSEPQYQQARGQPPVGTYIHEHPQQQQQQQQHQQQQHLHQHPGADGEQGGEWQASLCNCSPCTSCLLSTFLPCILLGQTSERMRDPSMQSADMLNSDCMIHGFIACFTGCGWIYALMKRGEIRQRYQIHGSGCGDCCVSFWCSCCALIQQDNEVKMRQAKLNQPVSQGYQPQPDMQMPTPSYQP
ncbi:PLAC8-domain-containing protein [Hypoxylon sp. NC1633]|nr:PLAC8-domain-containing protein [Hypoxylon sp. NC1633]